MQYPHCQPEDSEKPLERTCPHSLANLHQDLVRLLAARLYKQRWSDELPYDDYFQNGMVGLLEAAQRFDPSRGFKFTTFASPRIVGAMLDGLSEATERNRQVTTLRRRAVERAEQLASAANGDDTSVDGSLARIAEVAIGLAVGFMLEGSGLYSDGNEACNLDGYRSSVANQTREFLLQAATRLSERHRKIIDMHYFEHLSFTEIAAQLQLTKGRISQLHSEALKQLRGSLGHNLSDFEA